MLRVICLLALLGLINAQCDTTKVVLTFNSRRLPSKPVHWTNPDVFVKDLTQAPQPRGYCTKTVTSLASFTNAGMCRGPKSNIAYELTFKFYEPVGETWDIRWGPDVTTGFVVLQNGKIWSTELIQNNYGLWWQKKWNHPHVRDIKPAKFNAGWNTVQIIGGERCCDGAQALQFKRGSGPWTPLTTAALQTVCKIPPVCTTCGNCKQAAPCNKMGNCVWAGNTCQAKCASCGSCKSQVGCGNNPNCVWTANACHPKCSACSGCTTQPTCTALNRCTWVNGKCQNQCFTSCSCANNQAHCTKMNMCNWVGGKCQTQCLRCNCAMTQAVCATFGTQCQWTGGKCVNPCPPFPLKCSCLKSQGLCSTQGGGQCGWTSNTAGAQPTSFSCMPLVSQCSQALTQSMCGYLKQCQWNNGKCVTPTQQCSTCSACTTKSTCVDNNGKTNAPCTWLNGKCQSLPTYYCQCQPTPRANPQNGGRYPNWFYCDTKESPHIRSFVSPSGWSPRHEFGAGMWTTKTMKQNGKDVQAIVTTDDEWICCPGSAACDKP